MFSEENDPADEHMEGEEAESQFGSTDYIQHRVSLVYFFTYVKLEV